MINILRTKLKSTTTNYDKVCKKLTELSKQYDILHRDYAALREVAFSTQRDYEELRDELDIAQNRLEYYESMD